MATRPLALVQDASLYCYGEDFNKNVTEVFDAQGTITAAYDYSPLWTGGFHGQPRTTNVAELMHTTAGILIIIFLQLISFL